MILDSELELQDEIIFDAELINGAELDADLFDSVDIDEVFAAADPILLEASLSIEDTTFDVNASELIATGLKADGTDDYRKLKNKPSINGTTLYDNYNEIDPTVPKWAKEPVKPSYNSVEIAYDDTKTQLNATNIQEAIETIVATSAVEIIPIEEVISLWKVKGDDFE